MATSIPPFGGPASSTTKITSTRRGLDHIPVVDLDALQQASRVLQEQFVKDAQMIFDIGELLTARVSYFPRSVGPLLKTRHLQLVARHLRPTASPSTTLSSRFRNAGYFGFRSRFGSSTPVSRSGFLCRPC
jgi:hypothetical protein